MCSIVTLWVVLIVKPISSGFGFTCPSIYIYTLLLFTQGLLFSSYTIGELWACITQYDIYVCTHINIYWNAIYKLQHTSREHKTATVQWTSKNIATRKYFSHTHQCILIPLPDGEALTYLYPVIESHFWAVTANICWTISVRKISESVRERADKSIRKITWAHFEQMKFWFFEKTFCR